jgi:AhpC/TSA family protein
LTVDPRARPRDLHALRINDEAPNFTADTTQDTINFRGWIGTGWAILFSHPKDFTPVCTTELGYLARLKPRIREAQLQDHRDQCGSGDQPSEMACRYRGDRLDAAHCEAQSRHSGQLEACDDVIILTSVSDEEAKQKYPGAGGHPGRIYGL